MADTSSNENKKDLNQELKNKARRGRIKKIIKKVLIVAVIIAIFLMFRNGSKPVSGDNSFDFEEKNVAYGNINVMVEGDGVITANSIYNITPKVTGEILQDYVTVNEYVNKGDLLYVIDSKDINSTINQANIGVKQSNVAIEQAETSLNTVKDQINDLKIYASASGYISNLRIDKGSYVTAMSQVCNISEKNTYEVTLEFLSSSAKNAKVGDKVTLFFKDYFTSQEGTVSKIADSTIMKSNGAQVTNITVKVETTGYSVQNARVNGTLHLSTGQNILSDNEAYISNVSSDVVISNGTGVVKEMHVEEGSYVHNGDLIAVLENSNLNTQLDNAQISVKNAQISKENAQNSLNSTQKQLDNYNITSPISGKIVYKNAKLGDVISTYQQSTSNVMATVADVSVLKFDMQVDELDISKIKVGQNVIISVEALDNKEFAGNVSNVNLIGTNINGMTNYIVTIEVPGNDEIYSGMTVDAKINVANAENVLTVPLTAVRKGNVVYKKNVNAEYQDNDVSVPKGYEKVSVEIGLSDSDNIEIISGLSSGDIVLVDKVNESGKFELENLRNMMKEN